MGKPSFLAELKRRQIYRGGVMYVVAGWVLVQIATQVFPFFDIPNWAIRFVIVVILLGFPISLVWLWMFETAELPEPEPDPAEHRNGADSSVALARLMEAERAERQKENHDLIAALKELKAAETPAPGQRPVLMAAAPAPVIAAPPRAFVQRKPVPKPKRKATMVLSILAILIVLSGAWALLAPQSPFKQIAQPTELAEKYVVPGYHQFEQVGVALLKPLLKRLGIQVAPERILTALLLILALVVLRDLYRAVFKSKAKRAPLPHSRDRRARQN